MVAGDPAKFEVNKDSVEFAAARFVLSATRVKQLPADSRAEVAFAGRSNAGKSSVINTLSRNARLARISKTPYTSVFDGDWRLKNPLNAPKEEQKTVPAQQLRWSIWARAWPGRTISAAGNAPAS